MVTAGGKSSAPAQVFVSGSAPTVSSVAPNSTLAGSGQTSITVNGLNFGPGSVVRFTPPGGQPTSIAPSALASAQLAATIQASLLTTAGTAQIAVQNGLNVTSNQVPFYISPFTISGVTPSTLPAGSASTPITVTGANLASATTLSFTPPGGAPVTVSLTAVQAAQAAATIPAALLTSAGTAQVQLGNASGALSNQLPFTISMNAGLPVQPVAAFLDTNGAPGLTFNGTTNLPSAGGFLIGPPAVAQAPNGDTFIIGLDAVGGVHLNSFHYSTQSWNGWQYSGGILATSVPCPAGSVCGTLPPAVLTAAVAPNGIVWFTGRDIGHRYWINSWNGTSFGGWILLDSGIFAPDSVPQIAIPSDGSIYIVGKDIGGRVWSNRYVPSSQTFAGGSTGRPSWSASRRSPQVRMDWYMWVSAASSAAVRFTSNRSRLTTALIQPAG